MSTPSARHEVMRKKTYTQNSFRLRLRPRAKGSARKSTQRRRRPTAKGAPGQPSGAPQAKSPPKTFEDANTPNVPSDENDAASSPRGGVEEG